jgi:hypothetical protein
MQILYIFSTTEVSNCLLKPKLSAYAFKGPWHEIFDLWFFHKTKALTRVSGAQGDEKNQRSKISCQGPFKLSLIVYDVCGRCDREYQYYTIAFYSLIPLI